MCKCCHCRYHYIMYNSTQIPKMKKCCSNEPPQSPEFSLAAQAESIQLTLSNSSVKSSHSAGDLIFLSPYSLVQKNGDALEQQKAVDAQIKQIKSIEGDAPTLQRPQDISCKKPLHTCTTSNSNGTNVPIDIPTGQKTYRNT